MPQYLIQFDGMAYQRFLVEAKDEQAAEALASQALHVTPCPDCARRFSVSEWSFEHVETKPADQPWRAVTEGEPQYHIALVPDQDPER